VRATYGAPHHIVADGDVRTHRRTRAGDAHAAGQRPTTPRTTGLGLPTLGPPPAPTAPAPGCGAGPDASGSAALRAPATLTEV